MKLQSKNTILKSFHIEIVQRNCGSWGGETEQHRKGRGKDTKYKHKHVENVVRIKTKYTLNIISVYLTMKYIWKDIVP